LMNMSQLLTSLPLEVRLYLLNFCDHGDLRNLSLCSRQCYEETAPFLWSNILVPFTRLNDEILHVRNLKHTLHLQIRRSQNDSVSSDDTAKRKRATNFLHLVRSLDADQLKSITLVRQSFDCDIDVLGGAFPLLKSFSCTEFSLPCWGFLKQFRQLTKLCLTECDVSDHDLQNLNYLSLEELVLRECAGVSSKSMYSTSKATHLKYFAFSLQNNLKVEDFSNTLQQFKNVKRFVLSLSGNDIRDSTFSNAGNCFSKVTVLTLCVRYVTGEALAHLSALDALEEIHLDRCPRITASGFKHLSKIPSLTYIDLWNTAVDDSSLQDILIIPSLMKLSLNGCGCVTDEAFCHLEDQHSYLEELDISYTSVTDIGLLYLRHMNSLEKVYTGGSRITDDGAKCLSSLLPRVSMLKWSI